MKHRIIFSIIFLCTHRFALGTIDTYLSLPVSTQQVIIHFTKVPTDQHQHATWHEIITESLPLINDRLMHEGLIAPIISDLPRDIDIWGRFYHWIQYAYYRLFYRTQSLKYPQKKNRAFFTRVDKSLGMYAMYIPDGVPYELFVNYLQEIYAKKGIEFHIDPDARVHVAQGPDIGLEGKSLTIDQLEQFKTDTVPTPTSLAIKEALLWHQSFPTTGMQLTEPFWPPAYPYIPHFFSLWQLAPKKGEGTTVAVIDTGVAAYSIKNDPAFIQNRNLSLKTPPGAHNFNVVSADGLDPIDQLIQVISPYIDSNKFNQEYLENVMPEWIKIYISTNDATSIQKYLQEHGKSDVVDAQGTLTEKGQQALQEITTGDYGINPSKSGAHKHFTLQTLLNPYQEVITELLPMPRITKEKTTFIAGHGSHTFGIIAAQYGENNMGISGLAPYANALMIKAFQDNGISDKSTLISALKKALIHGADVVNLSLKIADTLDVTAASSALLERIVNLVPYLVAASGNNGDPTVPGYAGTVESYPARFALVPFDVGAFVYKNGKAYIAPFSQYEPGVGPLFVAPGFDILSAGLIPGQTEPSEYVFMAGTSTAAPIMSGFIALMLSEFKNIFTREQLLKVCYTSALKMNNDSDWNTKVILGVLDMRTALCILHALARFNDDLKKYPGTFDSTGKFDQVLAAVHFILRAPVQEYSKAYLGGIDFVTNFMPYFDAANQRKNQFNKKDFFIPDGLNALETTLQYISNTLLQALGIDRADPKASQNTVAAVTELLKKDTINLFPNLDEATQKRIREKETEQFWAQQADIEKLQKGEDV